MSKLLTQFFTEESGATAVEYGLIAALVSIAIAAPALALKGKVLGLYQQVAEAVPVDVPPPPPKGG